MTAYSTPLNSDSSGIKTSSDYGDRGDGVDAWYQWGRVADGGDIAQGDRSDAAVTSPSSDATVVALLKGLLSLTAVGTTSQGSSAIANGSGNVANASAAATLVAGGASKRTWVQKITVTGAGATAASVAALTVTGMTGGTRTWNIVIPAGATTSIIPLELDFGPGFPASADNTPITATMAAAGAGNTNMAVNIFGYVR